MSTPTASRAIRQAFLDFFASKQHEIVRSAPLINKDDPSLLFINAGMNQFKDIFTGAKPVGAPRIANTQRCLRVSGKHNDLEEVGYDTYHHTLFEMLGNWSFGDYFKPEAIAWAWEFITGVLGIDKDRLYVTIFEGLEEDKLPADEEAEALWKRHIAPERILRFGKKDNFWEMGETGPCGPCTELHVDMRSDEDRAQQPGHELVNADHNEVIEIWNVVFIQYDRKANGSLQPLAMKSVDTGMGFERLSMVMQDKRSSYDTDVFQYLIKALEKEHGLQYGQDKMTDVALRVAVDHVRAVALTIADGGLPGPTGEGYVIRRLVRRACRYGYQYLGIKQPFLYKLLPLLSEYFAGVFDELQQQEGHITQILQAEEKAFLQTLETGIKLFEQYMAQHDGKEKVIDGAFAFELYDTYGFPKDLTELMARERGWYVDSQGFEAAMAEQKARSKAAGKQELGDWVILQPAQETAFVGYDEVDAEGEILRYRSVKDKKGERYQLVLSRTPFYAEAGGQVGDTGTLSKGEETLQVLNTTKENELIVHWVNKLPEAPEGAWHGRIDEARRKQIRANHSATHLLHAALRQVLGEHVEQRGSLVAPGYLRFDFSHFERVSPEQLAEVEAIVNERIAEGIALGEFRNVPIEEAKAMGAMALFGEKYGNQVRVIQFDPGFSTELCGGTHVPNTLHIRLFKITSEGSAAAGIRRIEAVTGSAAVAYLEEQASLLEQLKAQLGNPQKPEKALHDLQAEKKQLEEQLKKLEGGQLADLAKELKTSGEPVGSIQLIARQVPVSSADALKQLSFELRKELEQTVILLGAEADGKALLALSITDDIADAAKLNAGSIIREVAKAIQGGGGGQHFFATAGGKKPEGIPQAIAKLKELLQA